MGVKFFGPQQTPDILCTVVVLQRHLLHPLFLWLSLLISSSTRPPLSLSYRRGRCDFPPSQIIIVSHTVLYYLAAPSYVWIGCVGPPLSYSGSCGVSPHSALMGLIRIYICLYCNFCRYVYCWLKFTHIAPFFIWRIFIFLLINVRNKQRKSLKRSQRTVFLHAPPNTTVLPAMLDESNSMWQL